MHFIHVHFCAFVLLHFITSCIDHFVCTSTDDAIVAPSANVMTYYQTVAYVCVHDSLINIRLILHCVWISLQ